MPRFCQDVIHAIVSKVQCMTPKDRVCALMIDEMSLKCFLANNRCNSLIVGYDDCSPGYSMKKVTSQQCFGVYD